ncbi:CaiB/BaiF CoA transferase family protein [Salaquimonas pukyongi]|uniref:CaiB/BaiF CoA transferase family protein n=1 Tax=Salaquimonas pukyongi TaxID=2712698 RepID=UPI00096B910F|nr:CaiB/BaiF CoA-transferase family protein [Salaquimonas pukyongi]
MAGPLAGLKIIEMAGLGPCPLAGQLLADMGADVIVVDRKGSKGDSADINRRSKRSVALDLKQPEAVEALLKIIADADILIEGFRPGVMERLGLGPQECHGRNPGLIYGRMTGWGQDGPLAHTAGHDINYLSITGVLAAIGLKDRPPIPPLNLAADYAGGTMFLLFGVLAALHERGSSKKGQVIDVAMSDCAPLLTGLIQTMIHHGQWREERQSNLLDGGAPFYRCYETSDGKHVSLGALEPQFFAEFVRIAGVEASDCASQYDAATWPEKHARYEALFKTRTRDEWSALFDGSDACVAPVLTASEAPGHPHNMARCVFADPGGVVQAAPSPRFSRTPAREPADAAMPGADTATVLQEAGLSGTEIDTLTGKTSG